MRKLTRGRRAKLLMYGLGLAVMAPGLAAYAASASAGARASAIVLPLANNTAVGGAELAQRVERALRLGLGSSGQASVMTLRPSAPAVQRAIEIDKTLEPSDLEMQPPIDRDRAAALGRVLGADMVLWGSIENYAYDERARAVSVGLNISKLDPRTGTVSVVAVTGQAQGKPGYNGGEGPLMTQAIDDAVSQVAKGVLGPAAVTAPTPTTAPPAPQVTKRKDKTWQALAVVLAIAAVAALSGDHGGAAAPAAGQVVSNAVATPTADTVGLSWEVASTATSVTSFNVYRAEMGGTSRMARPARAPRSRVRLTRQAGTYALLANVGRGDSAYIDSSAVVQTLYAYKINAVVGSAESASADFFNYYEQLKYAPVIEVGPGWPTAPAMPSVKSTGLSSLTLQWTKNPEPFISTYRVYRSSAQSGPWNSTTLRGQVAGTQNTFTDNGPLTSGATYFYAIGAVTAATGADGRVGQPREVVFEGTTPAAPTNVRAAPRIDGVYLTWTASPDTAVTGYKVYRATSATGPWTLLTDPAITALFYLDSPLAAGSYYYQVAAVAGAVESTRGAATPAPISPSSPPATLTIAGPLSVVANGISTVDVVATVRDGSSNPVPGVEVTFSITGGAGTLLAKSGYAATAVTGGLMVVSHSDGTAVVRYRGVATPGSAEVTATCTGASGPLSTPVTITLTPRVATTVTLAAASKTLVGDGASSTTLTATVKDQAGGGMSGITVAFASQSPSLGTVSPASGVTDSNGKATATLTSAAAGQYGTCVVTATVTGLTPAQETVLFIRPPTVTLSVDPSAIPAAGVGSTALVTATVKDSLGEPVADGAIIRFTFASGAVVSESGARIADNLQRVLTVGGIAYSTVISPAAMGATNFDDIRAWVDADDNGIWGGEPSGTGRLDYTQPPFLVTVTAEPTTLPADGHSVSQIVAKAVTAQDDPTGTGKVPVADGTAIRLRTDLGVFASSRTAEATGRTLAGTVSDFLVAPSDPGTATVTATSVFVSGSVRIAITSFPAMRVSIVTNPTTLPADGVSTSTITVHVQDSEGNPQVFVPVSILTNLGTLTASQLLTDNQGNVTTTFTAGLTSGTASIIARSGTASAICPLSLTSGPPHFISFTVVSPNGTIAATNGQPSPSGASPTATATARVTDKNGNPVRDGTPVFFHTDIGQITASALTTNGAATATLTSCSFRDATNNATVRAGRAYVTARTDSPAGPIVSAPSIMVFSGDASFIDFDGNPTRTELIVSSTPIAGETIPVYFEFYDSNDNPLPNGLDVGILIRQGDAVVEATATTNAVPDNVTGEVHSCWGRAYVKLPDEMTGNGYVEVSSPAVISGYLLVRQNIVVVHLGTP